MESLSRGFSLIGKPFKKEEYEFEVYFGDWRECKFKSDKHHIFFSPVNNDWNDFKFRISYNVHVLNSQGDCILGGELLLGFIDAETSRIKNNVIELRNEPTPASRLPDFFTLLGSMSEYRTLMVSQEDYDIARSILGAMNDLVELKKRSSKSLLVDRAEKTDVFKRAFMRNADHFFAYHNAESILDGLMGEDLSAMSSNLLLKYNLDAFSDELELNLKFDQKSLLPKRINVLIGKNGLGKSQALMAISKSLLYGRGQLVDVHLERPMISRLLAIVSPGDTSSSFPPERASNKWIKYRKIYLGGKNRSKSSQGFGDSIVQLLRSEEEIAGQLRYEIFQASLSFMSEFKNTVVEVDIDDDQDLRGIIYYKGKHYVRISKINKGSEQERLDLMGAVVKTSQPKNLIDRKVYPFSSGQLSFICFAVQACLFIENGTLILLDEPETHMHPNYISDFTRLLDSLLEATGSQAIMATHSAYFVREVPRDQVHIFKRNEYGAVDIIRPRLKTFGADVGSISYFVFDDDITNSLVDKLIEKLPSDKGGIIREIEALKGELSSDVIMYLRRRLEINREED